MSSTYEQKLDRARTLARDSGIWISYDVPPLLRAFGKLGLPVRPIHFMSGVGLFSYYFLVLGSIFLGVLWMIANLDFSVWPLDKLKDLGVTGTLAVAAFAALFDTIMVRVKAKRSGLPHWHDL